MARATLCHTLATPVILPCAIIYDVLVHICNDYVIKCFLFPIGSSAPPFRPKFASMDVECLTFAPMGVVGLDIDRYITITSP